MAKLGLHVSEAMLPSGKTSWKVSGTIGGRQIRRQFSDRSDALAFRDSENSKLTLRTDGRVPVLTSLSANELIQAEAAFTLLKAEPQPPGLLDLCHQQLALARFLPPSGAAKLASRLERLSQLYPQNSIVEALDLLLGGHRPGSDAPSLESALADYRGEKARQLRAAADASKPNAAANERRSGSLGERQMTGIARELMRLFTHFGGDRRIDTISSADLLNYLDQTGPKDADNKPRYTNKTWNNRKGYLSGFFKFSLRRGFLDTDPTANMGHQKVGRSTVGRNEILSPDEAARLMSHVEETAGGRMVPLFALALFGGIRPDPKDGEIGRVQPEMIHYDKKLIRLPASITKTGKPRDVELNPALAAFLEKYPITEYPIIATNYRKLYARIRRDMKLGRNVLRHTYISMLVARDDSVSAAAMSAGSSEGIVWNNYLHLSTKEDSKRFWAIRPTRLASGS